MTIGAYVLFGFLAIIILICMIAGSFYLSEQEYKAGSVAVIIIGFICIAAMFLAFKWYYGNTESGKRALKTQESNLDGGINRSVKVYDAIGNLLQEYEGKFDVDFDGDEQRILFDDENGKRHVIYFKTGTVIVEEKG